MNREDALDKLCRDGGKLVSPMWAEMVARAFDRTLDSIGIAPKPIKELAAEALGPWAPGQGGTASAVRIHYSHVDDKAVAVHDLSARLALSYGLYGSIDHAMQSPYHRAASEVRFIAVRGALRLARLFGGQEGVDRLHERNPWIERRLLVEKPYTGTGERLQ